MGSSRPTGTQGLQSPLVSTGDKAETRGGLTNCCINSLMETQLRSESVGQAGSLSSHTMLIFFFFKVQHK